MNIREIFICFLVWVAWIQIYPKGVVYVSTFGNDRNSGSFDSPLQTINAALFVSRKHNVKRILLRGGKYYDVNIKLTAADSSLLIKNYKNERVILYGGIKLFKFSYEGRFIVASLPNNKSDWDFRAILVNGEFRNRSRLPEIGFFEHKNVWNVKSLPALYGGWERKPTPDELLYMRYNPKDVAIWKDNIRNAEIAVQHEWDESYLEIQSMDTVEQNFKFTYPSGNVPGAYGNKKYVVWNTREGLTQPGQWYWDKTSCKVYYLPKENELVDQIIIPSQCNIITFEKGARNISLEGFTVSLSGNQMQNEGFACMKIDAAITGVQISKISIENLRFIAIGGNAIKLKGQQITIKDTQIKNCGGGGIYCAGSHIAIDNCNIDSMGLIFSGAVGIQVDGRHIRIIHCNIKSTPYSGICLGTDSCLIANCIIEHTMTSLQDGAAIFCGGHKNILVRNNTILGNNSNRFTMGIYFDELSQACTAENNIVVNCRIPIHCHLSQNILYNNNLFFDEKVQQINYGRSSDIALNGNIFIAPSIQCNGPSVYDAKTDTATIESKLRIYANPTGISSFQNNLLLITNKGDHKIENLKLPHVNKALLFGTNIEYVEGTKISDLNQILNKPTVKSYFRKIKLSRRQRAELLKIIHQ